MRPLYACRVDDRAHADLSRVALTLRLPLTAVVDALTMTALGYQHPHGPAVRAAVQAIARENRAHVSR